MLREECSEVVKPDIVSFTDRVQYNITELDDASLAEMVYVLCYPTYLPEILY